MLKFVFHIFICCCFVSCSPCNEEGKIIRKFIQPERKVQIWDTSAHGYIEQTIPETFNIVVQREGKDYELDFPVSQDEYKEYNIGDNFKIK